MNELVYRNLSEDAKRQICAWKYGGEYDLYNLPAYEEMQVRQIGFMNPKSEKNYYGFWDESILVGFVNILEEKEEIFIGIGGSATTEGGIGMLNECSRLLMRFQKSYILTSRCIWKFVHGISER